MKIIQKGEIYFVEGVDGVKGRFKTKEEAQSFAKEETLKVKDYFSSTRVKVALNSEEQLEAKL